MAAAVAGYVAYFGDYEVDEGAGVVAHHVTGAAFPAWVGATYRRRFALEGDLLTLSDDVVAADGVPVAASTTWQRVG
jgi:hypothetical protein